MASVTATINVQINAANAAAQLTALQGKVAAMNKGMLAATAGGVMAQEKAIRRMGNVLSGSGMFTTGIRNVHTELGRMHQEFDRGSTTLQKYRQNSRMWGKDHSAVNRMAADRVRMLQSQYVALGKEMNGVQQAMQIKPDRMMREFGADAEYAHQKAVLFRRNLQMGSTALVNWGKNTQWAGRQMMVGMGIPIAIMAAGAIRSFNDIEKSSIAFKRVYGDTTTSVAEKSQMLAKMQATVGKEMMKYGIAMSDTLDVSAKAAATGAQGADLIAATRETMRLATLGNMDYNKALEATIAMQTAFNINSKDMAKTTDFLNAVENQTILSMEDMALAVPRVAPVIKGLGGNVEDLAIMMTALRQGGVSAEQGANALKSGLGSLLNPTGTAIEQFDGLGINLKKIVDTNKGDLIGTIQGLGKALDGLTKYDRQRALESLFGKYQYARMGALLKNINSKAVRETMKMAKASPGELAKMSEAELGQIADSPMIKLRKSIEELKAAAAPLGALFSDIGAKIISFATPIVDFFAKNDVAKWGLVATAGFAALAGVVTMVVGVFANFAGSMVKAGMAVKTFFRFITGQRSLAYVTTDELQASAAANSLATAAERAAGGMMAEAKAAQLLTSQLEALIAAQNGAAATSRRGPGGPGGVPVVPSGTPVVPAPGVVPRGISDIDRAAAYKVALADAQRNHLGGAQLLATMGSNMSPQEKAVISQLQGLAKTKRAQEVLTNIPDGAQVYGQNNRVFMGPSQFNNETKSGIQASRWAAQMRSQGVNFTTASLMETVASNLGITDPDAQKAWANSSDGNRLRNAIFNGVVGDMERLGTTMVSDTGANGHQSIQAIANAAIDREVASFSPEIQEAVAKTGRIGRVMVTDPTGKPGNWYTLGAPESHGKQYDAATKGKVRVPDIVERMGGSQGFGGEGVPTVVTDKNGKTVAAAVPESSPAGRKISAASAYTPAGTSGVTYSASQLQQAASRKPPAPSQKPTTRTPTPYGMRGMGLMGVGMLAQTAIMGLEMAGKEVPNAVNFAVNGLMGIGMASMFFPDMMPKVAAGLTSVAASLGPLGIAIGAAVAAVGGTALLWNKINEDARNEGVALATAMNDAATGANDIATAFNNTSYVQEQKLREAGIDQNQLTTAQQFLQSEMGKQFIADYGKIATETSGTIAASSMGAKIASWVVQGVLTGKDVKGLVVAMNEQSPGSGNTIVAQARQLLGGDLKAQNPAEAARRILDSQSMNTASALSMMQNKSNTLNGPGVSGWMSGIAGLGQMATGVSPQGIANNFNVVKSLLSGNSPKDIVKGLPGIAQWNQAASDSQAREKLSTASANVWSSALKTAFQNRLAVEAQLVAMRKERNQLERKKTKGIASEDDIKRLGKVQKQIDNTKGSMKKFDSEINAGFKNMMDSGNMGDENWYKAQLRAGRQNAKKDSTGMYGYGVESINASKANVEEKNIALSSLNSGLLSPQAFSTITANGKAIENVSQVLDGLPSTKVQEMGTALDSMTGTQATNAVTKYGKQFKQMTADLKLTPQQKSDLMTALGIEKPNLKGVNPGKFGAGRMPKDLTQKIKERYIEDKKAKQKPKDQELKIKAKADTDGAEKKIKGLGDTVDATGKKKINIRASVNVGGAEKKIKGLGAAADAGASVEQVINRVIGNDETRIPPAPLIQIINRIIGLDMSLIPAIPLFQTVNRILGSTSLPPIPDAIQYVRRVPKNAMGGEVVTGYFASGGIHTGDGKVSGPGGPTDDKVNARLSDGEFVIRASSVDKYGTAFLSAINRGAYDKGGFAAGTPIKKAPLPPKEGDAKGRQADFMRDWRSVMYEADNFIKEFDNMKKIIVAGKKVLGKNLRGMDYEFGRWIMDNYSPRQIKKMFAKNKDAGAKKLSKQFKAEQILNIRDQTRQAKLERKAAEAAKGATGFGGAQEAQRNLSTEDVALRKFAPGAFKKLMAARESAEKQKQLASFASQVGRTDAMAFQNVGSRSDLAQAAENLEMSMTDIADAMANGKTADDIIALGNATKAATEALEIARMTGQQKNEEARSNMSSIIGLLGERAQAQGRNAIYGSQTLKKMGQGGKGQSQLEAESAVRQAEIDIKQAQIDDINQKYEKQLEIFDQISQQQQAIANLERGRLSVANALSTGDIAAAAMAAQEQRSSTASFMQEQMRMQLENQQKAQISALEDEINAKTKMNRDIQNEINYIMAQQQVLVAGQIDGYQQKIDALALENDGIAEQIRLLDARNLKLFPAPAAPAPPADTPPPLPPPPTPKIGGKIDDMAKKKKKKKNKAFGGWVPGIGNSDNVPLLATPGEFVMRKAAAARFGPTLQAMNSGSIKDIGGSGGGVNIDNIIFNINGANLDERAVADIAVRKMKSLDSATIRGGRF